jgi:hypothetical protein
VLPMCSVQHRMVGPPGFEPGTSCTPSKRASQAAPRPDVDVTPPYYTDIGGFLKFRSRRHRLC